MKVAFHTLGCKVNQYESQLMFEYMCEAGFVPVDDSSADITIINSCTVTAESDRKTRQVLHRFRRENPNAVIVLTGCMVQAFGEEASALSDADIIAGNTDIIKTVDLTEQFIRDKNLTELTDALSMTIPGESKKVKDKIAGGFTDSVATNPYGDGKTYLMPMFYSPCGLFYNQGLFKAKGWAVPKTWDEMWELGEKAKQEG